MKILVLGGDGFCGWPTSLHLSARGHEVSIVDNLSRRNIDNELEASSLTPIRPLGERMRVWKELTGKTIGFHNFNVAENYHRLLTLIRNGSPMPIVHFAEQRAAPYSMKSSFHKRYTVNNNLNATNNLLAAIVESGATPHRPSRHHGCLRLRRGRHENSGRLSADQGRRAGRHGNPAGDSVSGQSRQHLPYDQDAGSTAVRVL